MSIQDKSKISSKIKRISEVTRIHNFFIFNKSGICFYGKTFTSQFNIEKNLISPFITALMSFSKEMIGKNFQTIEMGDVKIVIFEKNDLYYGILCDSIEHITLLNEIISKINNQLLDYINTHRVNITAEIVYDNQLNKTIDIIVKEIFSKEYNLEKEKKVIAYLKDLTLNDNISGLILLTDKGKLLYSSLNRLDLKNFMKEVDFRVKIFNNSILKLFYTLKDRKFIFSEFINDLYLIILVFNSKVKFGVAEFILQKVVKNIKNSLLS
jgi:hypothetical protein